MTYTNELPAGAMFALVEPPLQAIIYMQEGVTSESMLDQDIEVTLPYQLRPEFGFAGMTVPFKSLLQFLKYSGIPLTRDRDLTLRHQARDERRVDEGTLYDRHMSLDLPPQALEELGTNGWAFDANYVLTLVADDVAETDPDYAERLRHIANTYFLEKDYDEPTEEELKHALGVIEEMIAAREQVLEDGGEATVMCRIGVK
jgi:hypothetical protein